MAKNKLYFDKIDLSNPKEYWTACLEMITDGNYNWTIEISDIVHQMNESESREYSKRYQEHKRDEPPLTYPERLQKGIEIFLRKFLTNDTIPDDLAENLTNKES